MRKLNKREVRNMVPVYNANSEIISKLKAVYEEILWLAKRQNITPSDARAWYTHIRAEKLKRSIRQFTGKVSIQAINDDAVDLRLEHYKRIQTTLTQLVKRHVEQSEDNPDEFIKTILDYEKVHIVTRDENYAAMRSKGDYSKAGIELVHWSEIEENRQKQLWKKMLSGKVANADDFKGFEKC